MFNMIPDILIIGVLLALLHFTTSLAIHYILIKECETGRYQDKRNDQQWADRQTLLSLVPGVNLVWLIQLAVTSNSAL